MQNRSRQPVDFIGTKNCRLDVPPFFKTLRRLAGMEIHPAQFDANPRGGQAARRRAVAARGLRRKPDFELMEVHVEREHPAADAETFIRCLALLIARDIQAEGQRGAND